MSAAACRGVRGAPVRAFHGARAASAQPTPPVAAAPAEAPASSAPPQETDMAIVGGGPVGLAVLAELVAHDALPAMHISLVDAMDLGRLRSWVETKRAQGREPSETHDGVAWENRVISMTADNLAWMRRIGAYEYLAAERVRPMERIRVWDGLTDAAAEFGGGAAGAESPLSYMMELSNVQQALLRFVEARLAGSPLQVRFVDQTRVGAIHAPSQEAPPLLELERDGARETLRARLLVGADGHNSPVRRFAGIDSFGWPYHRKGLVATVRTGITPHTNEPLVDAVGWQRFLPTGTLAFLPLSPSAGTVVWTLPPALCDAFIAHHREHAREDTATELAALISAGLRLPWEELEPLLHHAAEGALPWPEVPGAVQDAITRAEQQGCRPDPFIGMVPPWGDAVDTRSVAAFPLQLKHAGCYLGSTLNRRSTGLPLPSAVLGGALAALGLAPGGAGRGCGQARTALVGDAAHTTHPLAGQGMNMGIQDARALGAAVMDACAHGMDIGTHNALASFERERYFSNEVMLSATDHLHWLFATRPASAYAQVPLSGASAAVREAALKALVWARSTGLEVVNELSPLKRLFEQGAGSR